MRQWIWFVSLLLLTFSPLTYAAGKALVLTINGAIGPATQDYIERGMAYAEKQQARAVILQLDTPGGLESAMRGINKAIIASPIPVIAYVAPAGARAASAGLFIMYASHLAAMASGTHAGAASPVRLIGATKTADRQEPDTLAKKTVNDAAAYIRSLAQLRGRNAEWAELAVRQAASLSAIEAKNLKVINEIANDYPQLLDKVNSHTIVLQGASTVVHTNDLELTTLQPDWRYRFLSFITNPNIAYLLMLIAIYGLFFELSNPGLILPGVTGLIALLLVLYAFQLMPINYAGLTLLLIGISFMVFEMVVSSFGILGGGGVIAFILGSILLFDNHDPTFHLTWWLITSMSILTIAFIFVLMTLAIRSHKKAVVTGKEGLIGSEGIVLSVTNEKLSVRVLGEVWQARSPQRLKPGDNIQVVAVADLVLIVAPISLSVKSGEDQ